MDVIDGDKTLFDVLAGGRGTTFKARFSSPEISQYIGHITELSLPDLLQEPTNLGSESAQLTNSLTSLCHSEYPTFLSLHHTSSLLSTTFDSFSNSLASLLDAIPVLETEATKFTRETRDIQADRKKAAVVLEHHDKLVDILDVPQLIDTCVRNGYYQEAMDLSSHAKSLAAKFPDVAIIQDILAEVDHAMRHMLAQLLTLLREPAKLPVLFKAVSFLRKMGAFEDELQLALAFLSSRFVNLQNMVRGVEMEQTDHARYIRRYVDTWREGVHDVVTQFTTMFLDQSHAPRTQEYDVELSYLLSTFTTHMLDALIAMLSTNLRLVEDPTTYISLLTQLNYCSTSFARIGLDFRALLPPLFEDGVRVTFTTSLEKATLSFSNTVSDAQRYSKPPVQWLITPAAAGSPPDLKNGPSQQPIHVPPTILGSYPPLAVYTNDILAALNSLRLLAPVLLNQSLSTTLDDALSEALMSFLSYSRSTAELWHQKSRRTSINENPVDQEHIVRSALKVFVDAFVPFIRNALSVGVYGGKIIPECSEALADVLKQSHEWLSATETEPKQEQ